MRRNVCFSLLTACAVLALLSGCGTGKDAIVSGILPSRIENIMNSDVIPEDAGGMEDMGYDATAFQPRMFVGAWKLLHEEGEAAAMEVPAPSGSGAEHVTVKAFPNSIIFHDLVRGSGRDVYRIRFDDFYYMQAEYELAGESTDESGPAASVSDIGDALDFRMLYDTRDTTLAVGFTGEVTEEEYFNEDVDSVDICEVDYGFSWTGYELTLRSGNASATYVPSTFEKDMETACAGFSGGNGQSKLSDWHFSPLSMDGDGSGSIGTYYDTDVPVQYTFGEDGSFSVVTGYGEEFTYDCYWYSDSCLTLPAGDVKMMYQHDLISYSSEDEFRDKSIESTTFFEELTLAGKKMGGPLWSSVQDLIGKGYRTDVDPVSSTVPSGCITPEFDLAFRTARISVRAVNPTDVDLPLGACIVCAYRFDADSGSIRRRVRFTTGDETVSCGETTREELLAYTNLYPVSDDLLAVQLNTFESVSDYDFSDYSAHIPDGMDGSGTSVFLLMEMKEDTLHAVSCFLSVYADRELDYNVRYEALSDLSQEDREATAEYRNEIADALREKFAAFSGTACDRYGTVYVSWSDLFVYGKEELSAEGKQAVDRIYEQYAAVLKGYKNVSEIEIGACARCDLQEDGQSFTVRRAESVREYLSSEAKAGKTGGFAADRLSSAGYGETKYLTGEEAQNVSSNYVCFRFFLEPVTGDGARRDADFVVREAEGTGTYDFMRLDEKDVGRRRAALAAKYAGSYRNDCYANEAIGMEWELPDGWHFYDDDELTAYNGMSADSLLLKELPVYIFAAVDDDYDTMIDIRLYPCKGEVYDDAAEEYAESLFRSYEAVCRAEYSDVTAEAEDISIDGQSVKQGTFRFRADGQEFIRRQYYLVFDDAAVVISLSGTGDSGIPEDPGLGSRG